MVAISTQNIIINDMKLNQIAGNFIIGQALCRWVRRQGRHGRQNSQDQLRPFAFWRMQLAQPPLDDDHDEVFTMLL